MNNITNPMIVFLIYLGTRFDYEYFHGRSTSKL